MISYKITRKKTNPKLEIPFVSSILGIKRTSSGKLLAQNIEEISQSSEESKDKNATNPKKNNITDM